jgi:hypothetical protein
VPGGYDTADGEDTELVFVVTEHVKFEPVKEKPKPGVEVPDPA